MNLEIPFRMRGRDGVIRVEYGVNEEAERWGYHLLGLPYDHGISEGFPVVHATVEYEGEGYGAVMAWIQIVRYRIGGGGDDETVEVDKPPQLADTNAPHCYWGPNPSFFDAPSTTRENTAWTADAFITASPDAVMGKIVRPVCGFRWGYKVTGGKPEPLPLVGIPSGAWASAKNTLEERFPEWEFEAA